MSFVYFRILFLIFMVKGLKGAFLRYGLKYGDRNTPAGDDSAHCVPVSSRFPLFTYSGHSKLCIATNGFIGIDRSSTSTIYLAPYLLDLVNTGRDIFYRFTNDSFDINYINNDIRLILGKQPGTPNSFSAQYAFVVTYYSIRAWRSSARQTFQAILATDWKTTFLILNYDRLEREATIVGYFDKETVTRVILPNPYRNLVKTSNVEIPGKYVYMMRYVKPQVFYPYGREVNDSIQTIETDSHYSFHLRNLTYGWSFFSRINETFPLYATAEGVIHLGLTHVDPPSSSRTYIAPYYFRRSRSGFGKVYCRETTNSTLLDNINQDIQKSTLVRFNATRVFLVTYILKGYQFQVALATNGMETFAVLNYHLLERDALHVGMNEHLCGMKTFVPTLNSSKALLTSNTTGTPGRHVFSLTKEGCFVYAAGVKSNQKPFFTTTSSYATETRFTNKIFKTNEIGSANFLVTDMLYNDNLPKLSLPVYGEFIPTKLQGHYSSRHVIFMQPRHFFLKMNFLFLINGTQNSSNFQYGRITVINHDHYVTCQNIFFITEMASLPAIKVTPEIARNAYEEYANVWLRNVSRTGFTVCAKEMLAFSGNRTIVINYIAATSSSNILHETHHSILKPTETCKKLKLVKKYLAPPNVFISPEERSFGKSLISSWIKTTSMKEFEICATSPNNEELKMHVLVHGKLSDCKQSICPEHLECHHTSTTPLHCSCIASCNYTEESTEFCGSDYKTYPSMCQLNRDHCLKYGNDTKSNVTFLHLGKCRDEKFQAGRARLEAVQEMPGVFCKYINIDSKMFLPKKSNQPLKVLLTPSWNKESFDIPSDALASWSENVTVNGFKACVLVAGHHVISHFKSYPVIHWTVLLDVSFKEGSDIQSGAITMPTWYTGTRCKIIFTSNQVYHVYLTVQHAKPKSYQNALTLWTEIINSNTYRACARELQNFDGKHEGVILHWLAVLKTNVPVSIYIPEQIDVTFPKKYVSNDLRNTAECKTISYTRHYPSLPQPTVLIGGSFSDNSSSVYSKHDVAVWIEETNAINMTICMKSVLSVNLPPTTISVLIITNGKLIERSCENHQCENNGTCTVDDSLIFGCSCIEGYGGNRCQINLSNVEGCGNYTLHNDSWRSINNMKIESNKTSCDVTNLRYGWHRFVTHNADGQLANNCTTSGCGTKSPGWVNGTYPEEPLGLTNNTIYFHTIYCADDHGRVLIRNCGGFYTYKFLEFPYLSCNYGLCTP